MKNNLSELKVWNKSIDLCEKVYRITNDFPTEEKYGLISQMRRCSVSTASNIAEGAGRFSTGEFRHFLGMANGSSYELLTQVVISDRMKFVNQLSKEELVHDINEIQKMIYGLGKSLSAKN